MAVGVVLVGVVAISGDEMDAVSGMWTSLGKHVGGEEPVVIQWAVDRAKRNRRQHTGAMLRTVSRWRHVPVALAILVMAFLAGVSLIGAGDDSAFRPERFDAKQVTVWPEGTNGVRVREVVDVDFGINERRGYQRIIPNDFGVPIDVTARSPDANDELAVVLVGDETRIRVGNPEVTFTGRHRYILEYTLADPRVATGRLDLDIIGTEDTFETRRFEVVLTGFRFDALDCLTGNGTTLGDCEFSTGAGDNQVAVIEPLAAGNGITVSAEVASLSTPTLPDLPDAPGPAADGLSPMGLLMIPLGLFSAGSVFLLGRRAGSNSVVAGGATDAAFGSLRPPGATMSRGDVATYRVPDSRLAELATIEFVPPRGLAPWQGAVVLREVVDDETVSAWFSEMIANGAMVATQVDNEVSLARGADTSQLSAVDQGHLHRLFAGGEVIQLGTYDPEFTITWKAIEAEQVAFVGAAGWWSRGGPGGRATTPAKWITAAVGALVGLATLSVLVALAATQPFWAVLASPWLAVIGGLLVPLIAAAVAYRPMFASRTATGSALALRTESFRRFLAASEAKHVDWAWEHGLVREYRARGRLRSVRPRRGRRRSSRRTSPSPRSRSADRCSSTRPGRCSPRVALRRRVPEAEPVVVVSEVASAVAVAAAVRVRGDQRGTVGANAAIRPRTSLRWRLTTSVESLISCALGGFCPRSCRLVSSAVDSVDTD